MTYAAQQTNHHNGVHGTTTHMPSLLTLQAKGNRPAIHKSGMCVLNKGRKSKSNKNNACLNSLAQPALELPRHAAIKCHAQQQLQPMQQQLAQRAVESELAHALKAMLPAAATAGPKPAPSVLFQVVKLSKV
jgi:hypothetical protein